MKRVFALALFGVMAITALTACGKPEKSSNVQVTATEVPQTVTVTLPPATQDQPVTEANDILYGENEKARIEALLESDSVASKITLMKTSASERGYALEVKAEANKIVFSYVSQSGVDFESAKAIQQSISDNSDALVALAKDMRDKMGIRNAMVQVIILTPDGGTLSDKSYYPAADEAQPAPTTAANGANKSGIEE